MPVGLVERHIGVGRQSRADGFLVLLPVKFFHAVRFGQWFCPFGIFQFIEIPRVDLLFTDWMVTDVVPHSCSFYIFCITKRYPVVSKYPIFPLKRTFFDDTV